MGVSCARRLSPPPYRSSSPMYSRPSLRAVMPEQALSALFVLAGGTLPALCWAFARADLTMAMRPRMLALFFGAFAAFLGALLTIWYMSPRRREHLVWPIIILGVALRLAVAPVKPATTSDIYRYLWEGRVVRAGLNPYTDSPNSPRLIPLRDWTWPRVQHPTVSAAYPPVAQYVFAAAGALPGNRVTSLKLTLALFDIGTLLVLVSTLARAGLPRWPIILYAWHPLVICELVARGHLDTIGIFLLVLTIRLLLHGGRKGSAFAGAALAASIFAKGYALFAAPFLLRAASSRTRFALSAVIVGLAAVAPFASAGPDLLRGAAAYHRRWSDNGSIFMLLDGMLTHFTPAHDGAARIICVSALLVWIIWLLRASIRKPLTPIAAVRVSLFALIGFFLLSPTVYPWYLAWTLPLLGLTVAAEGKLSPLTLAWLLLTGAVFAFYAHDFAGHHREIWWVSVLEYGIPLAVAATWIIERRHQSRYSMAASRRAR